MTGVQPGLGGRQTVIAIFGHILMGFATAVGAMAVSDWYLGALGYVEQDIADKLRRMRIPTRRLRVWLIIWSILVVATFLGFFLGANSWIFGLLGAAFLACTPWYMIRRRAQLRKEKLEDQLADAMVTFASAIRAGLSMMQAMEILAEQAPRPIRDEFRQVVGEYGMGKPLEQVLLETKERLQSENFSLFCAALLASRASGGRLNETVERISHAIMEMQRLERKVRSETAQARKSAVYMAIIPFFILGAYYFMDPGMVERLFVTFPGQLVLSTAIVLDVVAYFWAILLLNPDI